MTTIVRDNPMEASSAPSGGGVKGIIKKAYVDFYSKEGPQALKRFQANFLTFTKTVVNLYENSTETPTPAQLQLFWQGQLGALITPDIFHKSLRIKSYVDITTEVHIVELFARYFCQEKETPDWTLESFLKPLAEVAEGNTELNNRRLARISFALLGKFYLEQGRLDEALEAIRRGLGCETCCPYCQKLLLEVWRTKMAADPTLTPPREIQTADLTECFCPSPFEVFEVLSNGDTALCKCAGWIPYSIGSLFGSGDANAMWNSEVAQELRRSVLDGDFSYCSRTLCPMIAQKKLPKKAEVKDPAFRSYIDNHTTVLPEGPHHVSLCYDATCNLKCPSCRTSILGATEAEKGVYKVVRDTKVMPLLKQVNGEVLITGWGDPFASEHYSSIMKALSPAEYPKLDLLIQTNGLLVNETRWEQFRHLEPMIHSLKVSVDAATAETYEIVRQPGKWSTITKSLQFISTLRRENRIKLFGLCFVVQRINFREIPAFIQMGIDLGADIVVFLKYWNFGGISEADYKYNNVCSPTHELHGEFLEVLKDPLWKHPIVERFNIS